MKNVWFGCRRHPYNLMVNRSPEARLFLKSLQIAGFKSFDAPTRLEFPPGITALVGPNGSGKSNIVEAIRWCLGEQSSRDLRGQRAEDVIHAGRKKVLGHAEVSLTFEDETDAFDWSELAVARRVFRSGESEYLLNRRKGRLRDVQGALLTLGIDNPRFVVVNQGMADSLLSATPAERRALLEQAAGLSGYRHRRDEAAGKLSATDGNIVVIEAVLAELEPRLKSLRRQARAVEERDDMAVRLAERLRLWYAWRWQEGSARVRALGDEVQSASAARTRESAELARLEEEAEAALVRERAWRSSVESATAALHVTERERDAARHGVDHAQQRLASLRATLEELDTRRRQIDSEVESARERHAGGSAALRDLDEQIAAKSEEAGRLTAAVEGAQADLECAVKAVRQIDTEREALVRETARAREREEACRTNLGHLERRRDELRKALVDADLESGRVADDRERRKIDREASQRSVAESGRRVAAAEGERERARQRAERIGSVAGHTRERLVRLRRAIAEGEGVAAALERSLGETVLGSLTVAEGWHVAVAAALGEWAFLPPEDVASLSGEQFSRFLAWRSSLGMPGVRWADEVVSTPRTLPALLLGAILAADRSEAESRWEQIAGCAASEVGMPWLQVVSREGVAIGPAGVRRQLVDDRASAYFRTTSELGRRRRRALEWSERQERLSAAARNAETDVRETTTRVAQLEDELRAGRRKEAEIYAELDRLRRRGEHLTRERDERTRELKTTLAKIATLHTERQALVSQVQGHGARLQSLDDRRQVAATTLQGMEARASEVKGRLQTIQGEVNVLRGRRSTEAKLVALLERDVERLLSEAASGQDRRRKAEEAHASSEAALQEAQARLEDLDKLHVEQSRMLAEVRARRPLLDDAREPLRQAREATSKAVGTHERAVARHGEARSELARLAAEVAHDLGCEPEDLAPVDPENVPTEDELRRLRARAAQYAEMDASVVEEYRDLAMRQEYLIAQVADLRAAAEGLHEIMAVADAEMRSRFAQALAAVNAEFGHVFRIMLRGGEAYLEQVDDEGGIEVRATLPGKRTRANTAFSGGERALVASSLLFGVLRTRPTPFCVLDEVDAALDETNVDRYLAALREISARTQVIVVTHNRATMAAANVLYGLTMNGDGASSVLSVRLDAYDEAV